MCNKRRGFNLIVADGKTKDFCDVLQDNLNNLLLGHIITVRRHYGVSNFTV